MAKKKTASKEKKAAEKLVKAIVATNGFELQLDGSSHKKGSDPFDVPESFLTAYYPDVQAYVDPVAKAEE